MDDKGEFSEGYLSLIEYTCMKEVYSSQYSRHHIFLVLSTYSKIVIQLPLALFAIEPINRQVIIGHT